MVKIMIVVLGSIMTNMAGPAYKYYSQEHNCPSSNHISSVVSKSSQYATLVSICPYLESNFSGTLCSYFSYILYHLFTYNNHNLSLDSIR